MMKIRYGLMGAAKIARKAHIPGFAAAEASGLYGIASRDAAKAQAWAEEFGITKSYSCYDEMLADPDIDAVLVALVHTHHAEWAIKAMEAGKHVLCEKPLAPYGHQVQAMQTAARENGVLLMEGFHHHFTPQFNFVKERITAGDIGDVREVRADLTYTIGSWENDSRADPALDAGVLLEAGCYCVNTIRYLMGAEPESADATAVLHAPGNFEKTLDATMRFSNNRTGVMHTSMEDPFRACAVVTGTEGSIEMPFLFSGDKVIVHSGAGERVHEFSPKNRFAAQLDHFSSCIRHNAEPEITMNDSLGNIRVIEQLLRAAGVR